jgi:hypothetical protein
MTIAQIITDLRSALPGPRCPGLTSTQTYKSSNTARSAGQRMANKINATVGSAPK